MRTSSWLRTTLAALFAGTLILTTGCGDMAIQSIKEGIYGYVSGSFASGLIAEQLAEFLGNVVPGGTTGLDTGV